MSDTVTPIALKIAGAFPALGTAERRLALATYRLLANGAPLDVQHLSRDVDLAKEWIEERFEVWPGVDRDGNGDVIGFWGLALDERPHRFKIDGQDLYTWCAWDGLFIPGLLGSTAEVESSCPVTGERITLKIGPAGVQDSSHPDARVSFLSPETPFDDGMVTTFCRWVRLFSSAEAGERWVADNPETFLLTLEESHEIGRRTNREIFGELKEVTV